LKKLLTKKFQLFCPSTDYIATKLADSTPFLKNFSPIPGANGCGANQFVLGCAADDNLIIP